MSWKSRNGPANWCSIRLMRLPKYFPKDWILTKFEKFWDWRPVDLIFKFWGPEETMFANLLCQVYVDLETGDLSIENLDMNLMCREPRLMMTTLWGPLSAYSSDQRSASKNRRWPIFAPKQNFVVCYTPSSQILPHTGKTAHNNKKCCAITYPYQRRRFESQLGSTH